MSNDDWAPGRWYRILTLAGDLWMETSNRDEVVEEAKRTGWPVQRLWRKTEQEWRPLS